MHHVDRRGFTLLEVIVASLLLTAGIGALLGTMATTLRTVVRARQAARRLEAGVAQVEALRSQAALGPADCGGLAAGVDSLGNGTALHWSVATTGVVREVLVEVSAPVPSGRAVDTLHASLWCP